MTQVTTIVVTSILTVFITIVAQVYLLPSILPELQGKLIPTSSIPEGASSVDSAAKVSGQSDTAADGTAGEDSATVLPPPPQHQAVAKTATKYSQLGDYVITLWARRAERRPSITMGNVTIVTHATLDRLPHLIRWCKQWRGPISASIFIKPGQKTEEIIAAMWDNADSCIQKHVDLHVVERTPAKADVNESDMFTYYPFNVQRNTALDGAIGANVFLLDIDFVMYPTSESRERVFSANFRNMVERYPDMFGDNTKFVAVVPAVETVNHDVRAPTSREELKTALDGNAVCAFYGHYCTRCHLPTNVKRFSSSNEPYEAAYEDGYEPYVVANRRFLPRYDEKFIGRGWDKMSFFYELNAMGKRFYVLPGTFLVHTGRGDQPKGGQYTEEYMNRQKENTMLMHNFKAEMAQKYNYYDASEQEDPNAAPKNVTDWSIASSSAGNPKACVSKLRGKLAPEDVKRLEDALSYACQHIDCSPLQKGGIRYYPRSLVLQADWAFDRFYSEAVRHGENPDVACNFSGAAKQVACAKQCFGCIARPTATKQRVSEAIKWVCGPDALEHCPYILGQLPDVNRTTNERAAVLFTFYYNVHRCAHLDADAACFFDGAGMRVPCTRVPP
jgi:hypothetical protein